MGWNLDDYETVDSRIHKFWDSYPMGRIETTLLSNERDRFIVSARLYRTDVDSLPFATGHAEELVSDRGVNATSALENAETSAIGRAMASAGISAKGKRPSREEMAKVQRLSAETPRTAIPDQHRPSGDSPIVKHPFNGDEKPIANEPETFVWDTESKAFEDKGTFIDTLKSALGADPISYGCSHGNRVFKEGVSKTNGKPWAMWSCVEKRKTDQCDPIWGKLIDGHWTFEARANQ